MVWWLAPGVAHLLASRAGVLGSGLVLLPCPASREPARGCQPLRYGVLGSDSDEVGLAVLDRLQYQPRDDPGAGLDCASLCRADRLSVLLGLHLVGGTLLVEAFRDPLPLLCPGFCTLGLTHESGNLVVDELHRAVSNEAVHGFCCAFGGDCESSVYAVASHRLDELLPCAAHLLVKDGVRSGHGHPCTP